ncbi:polysaccharide biosynthesis protein [Roseobacter ponti]|uniref:Polysaccharide biosynthesis protein n=1 Tax=Roseobacter ponti TaxID=1891787 RepID=A0A858SZF2_9RHOB|nr:nucleoside-diphosphate sugar epimerase/dehydratase [Roseobacter ponti]QJF52871.1 polysaccharide biosynthesis protein [Roseobacter ponti]
MSGQLAEYFINMKRRHKALLFLLIDMLLATLAVYLAVALRLSSFDIFPYWQGWLTSLLVLLPLTALFSMMLSVPWIAARTLNTAGILRLTQVSLLLGGVFFLINTWITWDIPRSSPLIFIPIVLVFWVAVRILSGSLLQKTDPAQETRQRVLIYGAGAAGVQLANALRGFGGAEAVAFVDDSPSMRRALLGSLRVHSPADIGQLIASKRVTQIILAMPSVSRSRKQKILQDLQQYNVTLQTLPHFIDFISGEPLTAQLRTVTSEDLLGRLQESLNTPEITADYKDRSVMVTGAGGSIGSELCMQLASVPVAKLVLFENSEVALYNVERKLREANVACEIVPVLASVLDQPRVRRTMEENRTEIVLHAAAYKHVPLVEHNEIVGARNNSVGTHLVAETCGVIGVKRFILISTDKAVRPTNVMGATKRMAEVLVQDLQKKHPATVFSMVRFGNVLGSSGSVIPLFREQIARGGPLTVTHPEVTRFFMTISEAAGLVLLAGTFARGGEVFLLNMGEPVRIMDLARNMLAFCGLSERTDDNPDGDIAITITGLRPGEKLYEELLISKDEIPTPHPKIMCARETFDVATDVSSALQRLRQAIEENDAGALRAVLQDYVEGYHPARHDVTAAGVPEKV